MALGWSPCGLNSLTSLKGEELVGGLYCMVVLCLPCVGQCSHDRL